MDFDNLEKNWNQFGINDPYWSILTDPEKKGNKWDVEKFYQTGEWNVRELFQKISTYNLPGNNDIALDFGCGAGRLTQALCKYYSHVIGVDIAESMIDLADRHNQYPHKCKYLVNKNTNLKIFENDKFDFILSFIVLQHMEQRYSREYIKEFLRILKPGGLLVFQQISGRAVLPDDTYKASIISEKDELTVNAGEKIPVELTIKNISDRTWPEQFFYAGNHWFKDDQLLKWDDQRAIIKDGLKPGEKNVISMDIVSPDLPGSYRLEFDLVHYGVCWFSDKKSRTLKIPIFIKGPKKNNTGSKRIPIKDNIIKIMSNLVKQKKASVDPVMELHPLPYNEVFEIINNNAGFLLTAEEDNWAGQEWVSYTYVVTKK